MVDSLIQSPLWNKPRYSRGPTAEGGETNSAQIRCSGAHFPNTRNWKLTAGPYQKGIPSAETDVPTPVWEGQSVSIQEFAPFKKNLIGHVDLPQPPGCRSSV